MRRTPKEELDNRVKNLQGRMASDGIDCVLIVQNADLLYFAGTVHKSFLFIPSSGKPLLLVRKNFERARDESFIDDMVFINDIRQLPIVLRDHGHESSGKLGMELDVLPVNQYRRFQKLFNPGEVVDISPAVQAIRSIKSPYEVEMMEEAAALVDFMAGVARSSLKAGMTEVELAGKVEAAARERGHQGYVRMRSFNQEIYWGYLVSGPDSAEPSFIDTTTGGRGVGVAFPSGAGLRTIGPNEPVIFDLVGVVEGYNSDETRTLCVGPLPGRLMEAYRVALEILQSLGDMAGPGVAAERLFLEAQQIADRCGLAEHFMGYGKQKPVFCGHGIGLELDELPILTRRNTEPLLPGMVFTVEPKFVFPGLGAVGVEDDFVVTETDVRKLTASTYEVEV